jgi:membrane associated rhomboid family serine protease
MKCPSCASELTPVKTRTALIHLCPNCRGIWTDGGEAQRVAAHLKINPQVAGIAKTLIERDQTSADLTELGEVMENPYIALESFGGGVPISDDTSTQTLPVVTLSIISVCVLLHVAQLILRADSETLFDRFGFIPAQPFSVGLITSLFLHAGLLHLIVNMLLFWVFGDNVEDKFGHSDFIFLYLACGMFGNLAHALFTPDQSIPLVGATAAYIKKRIEKPKPP